MPHLPKDSVAFYSKFFAKVQSLPIFLNLGPAWFGTHDPHTTANVLRLCFSGINV